MEFSFDVREGSQEGLRSPNASRPQAGARPAAQKAAPTGSDPASDRLRKAIERNRAKQAKRDGDSPTPQRAAPQRAQSPRGGQQQSQPSEAMLRAQAQAQAQAVRQRAAQARMGTAAPNSAPPQRPASSAQQQRSAAPPMGAAARMQSAQASRPTAASRMNTAGPEARPTARAAVKEQVKPAEEKKGFSIPGFGRKKAELEPMDDESLPVRATRKTVAKPESTEFLTALRKSPKKSPSSVGYSTAKRKVKTKKKGQKTEEMAISYLVKFAWGFAGFLLLRLVFAEGGVMDYYAGESLLNEKFEEHQMIQRDNKDLAAEIEKIRYDKNFQKKLVRDNLGFIAKDEYMILFPKNKVSSTR